MYSNTSAFINALFTCNCADAFTLFTSPAVGAGNTNALADVSVLTTPLLIISIISSNPALDLATAFALPPLPVINVAAAVFKYPIAARVATTCEPIATYAFAR